MQILAEEQAQVAVLSRDLVTGPYCEQKSPSSRQFDSFRLTPNHTFLSDSYSTGESASREGSLLGKKKDSELKQREKAIIEEWNY